MIGVVMALAAAAQETPPDYLALQERAARFAVAVHATVSCRHFDYETDSDGLRIKGQRMIDDAEVDGMVGGTADTIVSSAIRAETARQEQRSKSAKETGDSEGYLDYWRRLCAKLADDPEFASYFRRK